MNTQTLINPAVHAVDSVRHEIDRVFERIMTPSLATSWPSVRLLDSIRTHPALNVLEDDDNIYIEAEIPGVQAKDLDVTVVDGMLTIEGKRTVNTPADSTLLRGERTTLHFERTMKLPEGVDAEQINAAVEHGVLTLTLVKTGESRTRRIAVKVA